jgi:O-antigen/teichoic acid export membrane protein
VSHQPDGVAVAALPSLRRGFSWTLAGNVTYAACQWGVLVALAKLGGADAVGRFALGLAITTPVILFANLNLRRALTTDVAHAYAFGEYLRLMLLMMGLAMVLLVGVAFVGYSGETALVILALGAGKAMRSINELFYGLYQRREDMARIAIGNMISGGCAVILLTTVMSLTESVLYSAIAWAFGETIVLFAYNLPLGKTRTDASAGQQGARASYDASTNRIALRKHLALAWLAMPLGLTALLISLRANIPRYFIAEYWGESALGIFAGIAYVLVAGKMVMNALVQTVLPRLSSYFAANNLAAVRRLMIRLLGIALTMGVLSVVLAYVAGGALLARLYQPEYAAHTALITWLAVGMLLEFLEFFLDCALAAARYFRLLVSANFAAALICVAASTLLIPPYGMLGAALTLALTLLVQVLLKSALLMRITRVTRPDPCDDDSKSLSPEQAFGIRAIAPHRESRSFAQ